MRILSTVFTALILVFFLFTSCKKVESPASAPEGQLEKVALSDLSGIPAEYGKLVAVTTHTQYKDWAQLWFEDSVQTIRMVRVQFLSNQIHDQVLVIPRTK